MRQNAWMRAHARGCVCRGGGGAGPGDRSRAFALHGRGAAEPALLLPPGQAVADIRSHRPGGTSAAPQEQLGLAREQLRAELLAEVCAELLAEVWVWVCVCCGRCHSVAAQYALLVVWGW